MGALEQAHQHLAKAKEFLEAAERSKAEGAHADLPGGRRAQSPP